VKYSAQRVAASLGLNDTMRMSSMLAGFLMAPGTKDDFRFLFGYGFLSLRL
jgi:hypothetical protein